MIIITYFFLGIDDVKNQIVGALTYPVFIELTLKVTDLKDVVQLFVSNEAFGKSFIESMSDVRILISIAVILIIAYVFSKIVAKKFDLE